MLYILYIVVSNISIYIIYYYILTYVRRCRLKDCIAEQPAYLLSAIDITLLCSALTAKGNTGEVFVKSSLVLILLASTYSFRALLAAGMSI